ncbi:hypothetical protein ACA910_008157 [Epithemia clementina (nom. ined.)]
MTTPVPRRSHTPSPSPQEKPKGQPHGSKPKSTVSMIRQGGSVAAAASFRCFHLDPRFLLFKPGKRQKIVVIVAIVVSLYFVLAFVFFYRTASSSSTATTTSSWSVPQSQRNHHRHDQQQEQHQRIAKNDTDPTDPRLLDQFFTVGGVVFRPGSHYHCHKRSGGLITLPRLPSFLIVGVQKGGTSALNALLSRHRRIMRSSFFEPHFFDQHPAIANRQIKQAIRELRGVEHVQPNMTAAALAIRAVGRSTTTSLSGDAAAAAAAAINTIPYYHTPPLICDLREIYATSCFDLKRVLTHPGVLTYEKTPSYIFTDGSADVIQTMAPWAKIIVSLRHPIDRAFSQYKMHVELHAKRMINTTFEDVLARDLAVLRRKKFAVPDNEPFPQYDLATGLGANNRTVSSGWRRRLSTEAEVESEASNRTKVRRKRVQPGAIDGHWKFQNYIYRSMYVDQLRPWLERYKLGENLLLIRYERLNADPQTVLQEILEFLQIPDHTFQAEALAQSYSPNYWLQKQKKKKRAERRRERKRLSQLANNNNNTSNGIVNATTAEEDDDEVSIPKELLILRNETREYLHRLFEPYNEQLAELLGDEEWKHVWKQPERY